MIKPTTNLKKISQLKKRIWALQGSQGSAKTYSVLILLINHANNKENKEIYVASKELSKMKMTVIKDFKNIMVSLGYYNPKNHNKAENIYNFDNGSFIKFLGLDAEDIGKGLRSDIVFINEANKINFETYRELTSRAKRIILDYNPNGKFWVHDEIITRNDCDFIKLTFDGNEFLSQEERNEILRYKEKAYNEDGSIKSEYWLNIWTVYGLGEIGSVEGRIFTHFKRNTYAEFLNKPFPKVYGVDFGKNDPMAIIECKYDKDENNLYVNELNYLSENQIMMSLSDEDKFKLNQNPNGGIVVYLLQKFGVSKDSILVCDSAKPDHILTLRNYGYEYAYGIDKPKGSIMHGIGLLQSTNVIYTDNSNNIDFEQQNYRYKKDRLGVIDEEAEDENNHMMDAIRYVRRHFWKQYGR